MCWLQEYGINITNTRAAAQSRIMKLYPFDSITKSSSVIVDMGVEYEKQTGYRYRRYEKGAAEEVARKVTHEADGKG